MSEQQQAERKPEKENQGKGPSAFSQILDGAREVVHSAIDHILTHGAAHAAEHGGEALISGGEALNYILKLPYPGTCLLRPHADWLWRVQPVFKPAGILLETGGKILGSTAFALATEMIQESKSREYGNREENRDLKADERERALGAPFPPMPSATRIAAARQPKIEQGIAYKNGSVYFPVSRQWVLPPVIIRPSHPKHPRSHSRHTPHAHASLHVDVEVVGRMNSLPSALGLSVQRHFPGNHIRIKAVPISVDRGTPGHGEKLERLGNLVDLFLSACVYPPKPKM